MPKQRGGARTFWVTLVVLVVIAAIVLGVLGGLGYFKKKSGKGLPAIPASGSFQPSGTGTIVEPAQISLTNLQPVYRINKEVDPIGVSFNIEGSNCWMNAAASCSVTVNATYVYPDNTTSNFTQSYSGGETSGEVTFGGLAGGGRVPKLVSLNAYETMNGKRGPDGQDVSWALNN
jgi:hypothetical protein